MQCKHEIRSKEIEITKLRETLQKKAFGEKNTKGGPDCEFQGPVKANPQYKFSKVSGDSDFHLMISTENERRIKDMTRENEELRDCLVMLQRELMEIVTVKNDIFTKRFKAEYGAKTEIPPETEEAIQHQIETIKEELFNSSFDESGRELIQKFRTNFRRLKDFMIAVDKEIAQMAVFKQNEVDGTNEYAQPDALDENDKFSGISTVQ